MQAACDEGDFLRVQIIVRFLADLSNASVLLPAAMVSLLAAFVKAAAQPGTPGVSMVLIGYAHSVAASYKWRHRLYIRCSAVGSCHPTHSYTLARLSLARIHFSTAVPAARRRLWQFMRACVLIFVRCTFFLGVAGPCRHLCLHRALGHAVGRARLVRT